MRLASEPMFACRDGVKINDGSAGFNEILKERMGLLYLFFYLGPRPVSGFPQHADCPFVFPGGDLLIIDIVLFQQAVEVGYLRDHTNGTNHGERGRQYAVCYASHQIATTGCNFVDRDRDIDPSVTKTHDLGSGKTIGMDHAAGALQPYQHFIALAYPEQNSCHFLAQQGDFAGTDVAMEVQYKYTFLRLLWRILLRLGLGFSFFLLRFLSFFYERRRQGCHLECVRHIPEAIVDPLNVNLFRRGMAIAHSDADDTQQNADNQQKKRKGFCKKQAVFRQVGHGLSRSSLTGRRV